MLNKRDVSRMLAKPAPAANIATVINCTEPEKISNDILNVSTTLRFACVAIIPKEKAVATIETVKGNDSIKPALIDSF